MTTTPTPASQPSPAPNEMRVNKADPVRARLCATCEHEAAPDNVRPCNCCWNPLGDMYRRRVVPIAPVEQQSPARSDKDADAAELVTRESAEAAIAYLYRFVHVPGADKAAKELLAAKAQESAPSSELDIAAEREKFLLEYAREYPARTARDAAMAFEVEAGTMWLCARRATAGTTAPRNREADRARFPDPSFNRWLDEGISDAGHIVWDTIADTCSAWHAWNERQFHAGTTAAPTEAEESALDKMTWERNYWRKLAVAHAERATNTTPTGEKA